MQAHEKTKLFKIMTVHPEIDLSEAQSTTLLKELTARYGKSDPLKCICLFIVFCLLIFCFGFLLICCSGDKIKSLSALVKILCDLMRPC